MEKGSGKSVIGGLFRLCVPLCVYVVYTYRTCNENLCVQQREKWDEF